ncbi:unnamed protein product [Thelazia callipaeda]|uniref:ZP domain-containing protein n=1 Tax=Thelazia callipaeda TaxID=103827 RepID=A0A0N5CJZ3_THECL|nr:unnamed protein product [Thelazia callipaeda]
MGQLWNSRQLSVPFALLFPLCFWDLLPETSVVTVCGVTARAPQGPGPFDLTLINNAHYLFFHPVRVSSYIYTSPDTTSHRNLYGEKFCTAPFTHPILRYDFMYSQQTELGANIEVSFVDGGCGQSCAVAHRDFFTSRRPLMAGLVIITDCSFVEARNCDKKPISLAVLPPQTREFANKECTNALFILASNLGPDIESKNWVDCHIASEMFNLYLRWIGIFLSAYWRQFVNYVQFFSQSHGPISHCGGWKTAKRPHWGSSMVYGTACYGVGASTAVMSVGVNLTAKKEWQLAFFYRYLKLAPL